MNNFGRALAFVMAVSPAGAVLPPAEIDVVFPRGNETYGIVAPFPLVFGLRNIENSTVMGFSWTVTCEYSTFSSFDELDSDQLPGHHAEPLYLLNATRLWYDQDQDAFFNKNGPLGWWTGDTDTCTLAWKYSAPVCKDLSDGIFEISTGPDVVGNLTFHLRPGGKLPHDAILSLDGCPVAAVGLVDNSTRVCIDNYKTSSDVNPCGLDIKAAASSIAAAVVSPSTTFTSLPTTTTTIASDSPQVRLFPSLFSHISLTDLATYL